MLPVGAFNFEPSPGDKARTSKLAPSVPLLPPSHGRTGKGGLPKDQALSAPAERTDWSSGSDPLQSKLERWCQLLDTAPGDILTRHGARSPSPGSQLQVLPPPEPRTGRGVSPSPSPLWPSRASQGPDENTCHLLHVLPVRCRETVAAKQHLGNITFQTCATADYCSFGTARKATCSEG